MPQVIVTLVCGIQIANAFTYYIQVTLCIQNLMNSCDITLWVEIATPLNQRFIHQLFA